MNNEKNENIITRDPGTLVEKYIKIKELGSGSYGKVYEIENKTTKEKFACKHITKRKICDMDRFNNEINIMKQCNHPNIIKLYEIYEDQRHIDLVMEECLGGELFDRIMKRIEEKKIYTEKEASIIFKQIMKGIEYCHSKGIVHRDLKPENILFLTKEENSQIKIIDFGLSKIFGEKNNNKSKFMKTKVGTAYYVSPEILEGNYNEKCDIWSAGVILYILLSGIPPFNGESDNEIYQKIYKREFNFPDNEWKNISENAKDLIRKMLCDEDKRLNAKNVLEHPWLNDNENEVKKKEKLVLDNFNQEKLKQYQNIPKLKKNILTFIVNKFCNKDIHNLKNIFEELDVNKKGKLTYEEFKNGLIKLSIDNIKDEDIQKIFNKDIDNTSKIDYIEFLAISLNHKNYLTEENLNDACKLIDKTNCGKISKKDLKDIINNQLDNQLIDKMILDFDLNGDGLIDYNEFLNGMTL